VHIGFLTMTWIGWRNDMHLVPQFLKLRREGANRNHDAIHNRTVALAKKSDPHGRAYRWEFMSALSMADNGSLTRTPKVRQPMARSMGGREA